MSDGASTPVKEDSTSPTPTVGSAAGSPTQRTAKATASSDVQLSMGGMNDLSNLDLKNPFVTVQVDSNRINTTFEAILEALSNVRVVVSNVCTAVEGNKMDISKLQNSLGEFKKQWENDPRFSAMEEKHQAHGVRITALENGLAGLQTRVENFDKRLATQESKRVDFTPIENQLKELKKGLGEVNARANSLEASSESHEHRLVSIGDEIASLKTDAGRTSEKVKALYDIFEMTQDTVIALTKDPKSYDKREDTGICALTDYVIGLPSFQHVYGKLNLSIEELRKFATEGLSQQKRKLAEESASLRARLGEKLDEKQFHPVRHEVEVLSSKLTAVIPKVDKLEDEMEGKATMVTTQKLFDHLDSVKANKADLVGLLYRDDLLPIEKDIQQLAEAIDSSGAKLKLELHEAKQQQQKQRPTTPVVEQVVRRGSDTQILARISGVEQDVKILKEEKLGKDALADVYMYLDNNLAKLQVQVQSMPDPLPPISATPGLTPSTEGPSSRPTSGKQRLAPLMRPPSAGKERGEFPSSSIPEQVRSPSPPIQYTSSPAKYVPNPAKYRATASIYDSDGNRTLATVTAANVPAVDHWHNVARAAAGEEVIPASMRRHSMD